MGYCKEVGDYVFASFCRKCELGRMMECPKRLQAFTRGNVHHKNKMKTTKRKKQKYYSLAKAV